MPGQEIKYDGSDSEMMKLGLIDESGSLIVERRNEYKEYMQMAQQKKMVIPAPAPDREKMEEYFRAREYQRKARIARCRAFITKLFGRSK